VVAIRALKLRTKVTLGIALIVAVTIALCSSVSFLALRREHLAGLERRALALTRNTVQPFSQTLGMPLGDFMCAFCHFCRAEMVDRLTGGVFQVWDVENDLRHPVPGRGVYRFRVEPRPSQRRAGNSPGVSMETVR
jgi:hypothetical protein